MSKLSYYGLLTRENVLSGCGVKPVFYASQ